MFYEILRCQCQCHDLPEVSDVVNTESSEMYSQCEGRHVKSRSVCFSCYSYSKIKVQLQRIKKETSL